MSTIQLDHVSRWFRNVVAVNDVTMTIGPGVTGLLGPNGAGKSTLIAMMSGFLAPSTGTVTLDGEPLWRNEQVYRKIGLVPEREALFEYLTGRQFVVANAELHGLADAGAAAQAAIALVEMTDAQDRVDLDVLQGHAAADQDGVVAGAPAVGAAARRAVQRHGPPAADPPDGPAAHDGHRGPHGAVQLAHPRGGRAGRPADRGRGVRPARRVGRLRRDPAADDRPAEPVRAAHRRRPAAGVGAAARPVGPRRPAAVRGRHRARGLRLRPVQRDPAARWPASTTYACSR